ncbi:hypothetical protein F2Q70_00024687 [Brassica cretica]|uniref:Uncharacterized protein n=1 Tax=Brassica cretica TaxID=69181 RepID=A0A8S9LAC7_BRACR|nr:hypothetical protein F2Q70_00024687 [Brassica cretica]
MQMSLSGRKQTLRFYPSLALNYSYRAPLVNSDGDSWDAFPNNLVYVLNGCVFCFSVGVLLKRGFAFSVYNMNILLEGLCKNLEYGKTVTLLREVIKFEFSAAGCC